ncbi:dihydrodipicolinate synthase/N-acetylneuraminate lyase [Proteiniphilum saccharofermentans]|jgi:dihydrodipicolinate synthase/N-acetylneuraminate lyase|uniref:Dihydrodipicolinate synthase/N-acetylneuraminate lyase n=1 Tax=Proteiniphilum saccharofermentans TaxID=1642647 RepID=A0A1R3SZ54_9BACT|nr:dihydrodipicolinate synthase family protein [Proteiniphilum saccharofermentans]SCD19159.1 dihydrodipicolinate synthase/N-acetylneuraminate lyase [Proteiniphilum saccharofermentans]SDZ73505.1 Dihydrodipicolinate synthase/N-acetylneuraminate lyase [Porphyromonadaceae bacterium KH3R12]
MNVTINPKALERLRGGGCIPAHPLALHEDLTIDEEMQRRLTRYYISCGVDGIAIGVHTTQFEIRDPEYDYYEKVLEITADEIKKVNPDTSFIKVAGICGPTPQAVKEARIAKNLGYDLGLLSMGGLSSLSEKELIERTKAVAQEIPVFGFYLQPSVGGRIFSYSFWKEFCDIDNVYAIKTAPFNRYHTLEVVRAICNSRRNKEISLYTGNDDNIVLDLITPYRIHTGDRLVEKRFVGGLLGHYAVWTKKSVELFHHIKDGLQNNTLDYDEILKIAVEVTDMNAAIFDVVNNFKGSIAGIHEVLRRQGLLKGIWCLSPKEKLSEGQADEIGRVISQYEKWTDDNYVKEFIANDRCH